MKLDNMLGLNKLAVYREGWATIKLDFTSKTVFVPTSTKTKKGDVSEPKSKDTQGRKCLVHQRIPWHKVQNSKPNTAPRLSPLVSTVER